MAGHERGDRRGDRPTLVTVVGQAQGHEKRTQVGVSQPELTEGPGGLADGVCRVVGVADQDLLSGEHHLDGVTEALDVETADGLGVVVGSPQEGQEVEAGQIAGRVIEMDVLRAVRHHESVHDERVVPSLGDVVREGVALVSPRGQTGSGGRPVVGPLPSLEQFDEQQVLAFELEAHVGGEGLDRLAGDPQIPTGVPPLGGRLGAVIPDVPEGRPATVVDRLDPGGDAQGLEHPLDTGQELTGDGAEAHVRTVGFGPVDAAVGVEQPPQKRRGDLRWCLLDRPRHDPVGTGHRTDPQRLQEPLERSTGQPELDGAVGLLGRLQRPVAVDPLQEGMMSGKDLVTILGRAVDGGRGRPGGGAVAHQPTQVVAEEGAPLVGEPQFAGVVALTTMVVGIR